MTTEQDIIVLDSNSIHQALLAENSRAELDKLLSSLDMQSNPSKTFNPMGAVLFTELGASSPYYVPIHKRLSAGHLLKKDSCQNDRTPEDVVYAVHKVAWAFNLRLLESLASASPSERKLIRDAVTSESIIQGKAHEWMHGLLQNIVLDRIWWSLNDLDVTQSGSPLSHVGYGLRISQEPPKSMQTAVNLYRKWEETLARFVSAWDDVYARKKITASDSNGIPQPMPIKPRPEQLRLTDALTVDPEPTPEPGIGSTLASSNVTSSTSDMQESAGDMQTTGRSTEIAFRERMTDIVQRFMKHGKGVGNEAHVNRTQHNFLQASLGLLGLVLVSQVLHVTDCGMIAHHGTHQLSDEPETPKAGPATQAKGNGKTSQNHAKAKNSDKLICTLAA